MKLHAGKRQTPVIPTASMADIAFLLIIFFMVTITFEVDKTQVTLPDTQLRFEVPKKSAYISVTEDGTIRVSTRRGDQRGGAGARRTSSRSPPRWSPPIPRRCS